MNRVGKILVLLAVNFLLVAKLFAIVPDSYQTILDRNVFGLNPPPPPPTNNVDTPPPANINLTGFLKMKDQPVRAFFVIQPKDAKEQAQYINLSEGQREGIIE